MPATNRGGELVSYGNLKTMLRPTSRAEGSQFTTKSTKITKKENGSGARRRLLG